MTLRTLTAHITTCVTLAVAAVAAPAHASLGGASAVTCDDSFDTTSNAGYISCQGPLAGNIAAKQNSVATFAGYGSFNYAGASNLGTVTFKSHPSDATSGQLSFTTPLTGTFVLGIKGANSYSLYLFDAGQGSIDTLDFDTFGIIKGNGKGGPGLSHAVLFTSAVPEPTSLALMIGGLLAVGFVARRRIGR